jgi:hypothetical protein
VPERLTIDLDATLIGSHSEKEGAAGNFNGRYGLHPMLAYGDEADEALAGVTGPRSGDQIRTSVKTGLAQGVLELILRAASQLATQGWVLRTGMAGGADQAFYRGATVHGALELYLPWPAFEADARSPAGDAEQFVLAQPTPAAYELAAQFHPAWSRCSQGARRLHARNCHQVLGPDLASPARFVLCWTPTAASMAVAGASAGPARRFGSPTTTPFRSSTSLAPSTPSASHGTAPVRLADAGG